MKAIIIIKINQNKYKKNKYKKLMMKKNYLKNLMKLNRTKVIIIIMKIKIKINIEKMIPSKTALNTSKFNKSILIIKKISI